MIERQRGALNLVWVAIFSALVAGAAMAALWSMRNERNLFAEGAAAAVSAAPARQALDSARQAVAAVNGGNGGNGGNGAMRKCVIDGMTVVSNTDCLDTNKTSKVIKISDTRGIEAPKAPPPPPAAGPTSNPATDKIIEKQLQ